MEDKVAIEALTKLLKKDILNSREKEAVLTAIGILSWSKLGKGRMKSIVSAHKAKKEKDFEGIEDFRK